MAFELKDGQGSLFKNTKKQKENHPDYQGECKVGGVKYRISGWKKKSAKGTDWLSLSVQPDRAGEKHDDGTPF